MQDALAAIYTSEQQILQIIQRAGIDTSWLDLNGSPSDMWFTALSGLHERRLVTELVVDGVIPDIIARQKEFREYLDKYTEELQGQQNLISLGKKLQAGGSVEEDEPTTGKSGSKLSGDRPRERSSPGSTQVAAVNRVLDSARSTIAKNLDPLDLEDAIQQADQLGDDLAQIPTEDALARILDFTRAIAASVLGIPKPERQNWSPVFEPLTDACLMLGESLEGTDQDRDVQILGLVHMYWELETKSASWNAAKRASISHRSNVSEGPTSKASKARLSGPEADAQEKDYSALKQIGGES